MKDVATMRGSRKQMVEVRTKRLLLRGAVEDDLPAFRKWLEDSEAMKYWSTAVHTDIEETQDVLDTMIESPYNGKLEFVICLRDSSSDSDDASSKPEEPKPVVIGLVGIWDGEEIGFILNQDYWGKGYASEAVRALLNKFWSENEGDNVLIKADVDPRNESCLKLLKNLGFVEVGMAKSTYKTHIGWCDSIYLELRKPNVNYS